MEASSPLVRKAWDSRKLKFRDDQIDNVLTERNGEIIIVPGGDFD